MLLCRPQPPKNDWDTLRALAVEVRTRPPQMLHMEVAAAFGNTAQCFLNKSNFQEALFAANSALEHLAKCTSEEKKVDASNLHELFEYQQQRDRGSALKPACSYKDQKLRTLASKFWLRKSTAHQGLGEVDSAKECAEKGKLP